MISLNEHSFVSTALVSCRLASRSDGWSANAAVRLTWRQ